VRLSKQILTGMLAFFGLIAGSVIYSSTIGELTRLPELEVTLAAPLDEDRLPPAAAANENESVVAAQRGFGRDCPQQDCQLQLTLRDLAGPGRTGRGLGLYVYINEREILKEDNRRIKLTPFSMVYIAPAKQGGREKDEIVTVVADEAVLTFEKPIDLVRFNQMTPTSATLKGNVATRVGRGTPDDPDDDLLVNFTRAADDDAKQEDAPVHYLVKEKRLWTHGGVHLIDPQVGADVVGTGMEAVLMPDPAPGASPGGREVELKHVSLQKNTRFHMEVAADQDFLGAPNGSKAGRTGPPMKSPTVVTSRGPFLYDAQNLQADFDAGVKVWRRLMLPKRDAPAGAAAPLEERFDTLQAEHLTLRFAPKKSTAIVAAPTPKPKNAEGAPTVRGGPAGGLQLIAVRATGADSSIVSESEGLVVFGSDIIFDVLGGKAEVTSDGKPVFVQYDTARIWTTTLLVERFPQGKGLKSLVANGPKGQLEAREAPKPGAAEPAGDDPTLVVTWKKRLQVSPSPGSDMQLVTISGDVEVDARRESMSVKSDELKLWLSPSVAGAADPLAARSGNLAGRAGRRLEPVRIEARAEPTRKVTASSDEFHVTGDVLVVNVLRSNPAAVRTVAPALEPVADQARLPGPPAADRGAASGTAKPRTAPDKGGAAANGLVVRGGTTERKQPISVTAGVVDLTVVREANGKARPLKALADGEVQVVRPADEPGRAPGKLMGSRLEFERGDAGDRMTLSGGGIERPAQVDSAELLAAGTRKITVDEAKNRVEIEGRGYLIRDSDTDFNGRKLAKPQKLRIDFDQGMTLIEGLVAEFVGDVFARQLPEGALLADPNKEVGDASLRADNMQVTFDRAIDFRQLRARQSRGPREPVGVSQVIATGDCHVFEAERDDAGKVVRRIKLDSQEVRYFREGKGPDRDEDMQAAGPGVVHLWNPGSERPAETAPGARPAEKNRRDPSLPFDYTRVDFRGRLQAVKRRGTVKVFEDVKILHGPVASMTAVVDPDKLTEGGLFIEAREKAVVQQTEIGRGVRQQEFQANDDVRVRSAEFTGRCDELSYSREKDMLVFKSKPDRTVLLIRQLEAGGSTDRTEARRISYWPRTRRIDVEESSGINLLDLEPGNRGVKRR
jgi:hypothetical protein